MVWPSHTAHIQTFNCYFDEITLDAILDVTKGIAITEGLFAQM